MASHQTLDVYGHPLLVTTTGTGGVPVLLLHGWTATAEINWGATLDLLGERFRFVTYDQRGHGAGLPRGPQPITMQRYADDAATVLDHLGVPAVVVGYSMGGAVAQQLWRDHPDRVRALVLAATATHFVDPGMSRGAARAALGAGVLAARRLTPAQKQALQGWAAAGHRQQEHLNPGVVAGHDFTALVEAGQALVDFDSRSWLGQCRLPVAVLAPTLDTVVPFARQLKTIQLVRGATLDPLPGGHSSCLEYPREFAGVLAGVLARLGTQ